MICPSSVSRYERLMERGSSHASCRSSLAPPIDISDGRRQTAGLFLGLAVGTCLSAKSFALALSLLAVDGLATSDRELAGLLEPDVAKLSEAGRHRGSGGGARPMSTATHAGRRRDSAMARRPTHLWRRLLGRFLDPEGGLVARQ